MAQATLPSPIGLVLIDGDPRYVRAIHILAPGMAAPPLDGDPDAPVRDALDQLAVYFAGRLKAFDLPLAPLASDRGNALRAAIMAIGYGDQLSYGALARIAASGPRAIGQACSRNPFPIVVPCHRVTGSGGTIGHYSAGAGISAKQWLLNHERKDLFRGQDD